MFDKTMAPVGLAHTDGLETARTPAAIRGRHASATATATVTPARASRPHTPRDCAPRLRRVARTQAEAHGTDATSHAVTRPATATNPNATRLQGARDIGASLIAVASRIQILADPLRHLPDGTAARRATASARMLRETQHQETS